MQEAASKTKLNFLRVKALSNRRSGQGNAEENSGNIIGDLSGKFPKETFTDPKDLFDMQF